MKILSILLLVALSVCNTEAIETYRPEPQLPKEWERLHPADDTTKMVVTLTNAVACSLQLPVLRHRQLALDMCARSINRPLSGSRPFSMGISLVGGMYFWRSAGPHSTWGAHGQDSVLHWLSLVLSSLIVLRLFLFLVVCR